MLDALVIGGGFWGSAITLRLLQSGWSTLCLDARLEGAASPAAGGLVRAGAWESCKARWWEERHSQACRNFFQRDWVAERVCSRYAPEPRLKGEVWCGSLAWAPRRLAQVWRLRAEAGSWWAEGRDCQWRARRLVLAAGCWCDSILSESGLPSTGVQASRGQALLARGDFQGVLTRNYRLAGDTRTRSMTLRTWSAGQVRLGDTLPDRELEQLSEMRQFLGQIQAVEEEQIWGLRPRLARPLVELWAPGLVVATGGYRNGLALAPGVALRVLELLSGPVPGDHGPFVGLVAKSVDGLESDPLVSS